MARFMRKIELEYLNDCILMDRLCSLEFGLIKNAGILDMLGSAASSIKDTVGQQFEEGGAVGGLANIMAPAILFRLHPIVGVLYLIGTSFGLDITSIYHKIMNLLAPKLQKGEQVTPSEVNDIGKEVVGEETGMSVVTFDLSNYERLIRTADLFGNNPFTGSNRAPWLMSDKSDSPLTKMFRDLVERGQAGKAKSLLGAIVVWLVKTVLAGAGLLAITGAVSKMLGHKDNTAQSNKSESPTQFTSQPASVQSTNSTITLQPSGRGEQTFPNDDSHLWVVPLIRENVRDTLITWAIDVYPQLQPHIEQIENTSSFEKMVGLLQANYKSTSPGQLVMPKGFNSRKQVVDSIVK